MSYATKCVRRYIDMSRVLERDLYSDEIVSRLREMIKEFDLEDEEDEYDDD